MTLYRSVDWRRVRAACVLLLCFALTPLAQAERLADVTVTGLNKTQADSVRASLSLTQLTDVQRQALTPGRLAFLLRRAERESLTALEPFGLYNASVEVATEAGGDGIRVRIAVDPGEPVRVTESTIRVAGPAGEEDSITALITAFRPSVGQVFVHSRYENSKSAIARELARRGYFAADTERARVEIVRAEHSARIDLSWIGGPRYRLGEARFEGSPLRPDLLDPLRPWRAGDPYHQDALLEFQQRLTDLDYFSVVDVRPDVDAGPDAQAEAPVQVTLTPAKPNVYSAALSFGTDSGVGTQLGYERRWLNRHGHKFKGELQLAQRRQAAVAQYRIPAFARGPGWWALRGSYRQEEFEGFDLSTAELTAERTWRWGQWNMTAAGTGQRETLNDKRARSAIPIVTNKTLAYPSLTAQTRRSDDPVFTRRGWSLDATARGGSDALLSDVNFIQLRGEGRFIRALSDSMRLLLRSEAGATWVEDIRDLPVGLRFFAGGDRSLRGYDLRTVGPRIDEAVVGGRYALIGSAEIDHYFGDSKWGMAAFVDAGNVVNEIADYDPVFGAGLGLRWRSPVGPIRLDLAHGFDNPDENFRIHLTIGPDL